MEISAYKAFPSFSGQTIIRFGVWFYTTLYCIDMMLISTT